MSADIFTVLAACCFLGLLLYVIFRLRSGKMQIGTILLIIFVSCFFLFFPYYWQESNAESSQYLFPELRSLTLALFYSLKALTGGHEAKNMVNATAFGELYVILNYLILATAPFLTSSLLISMVGDWAARIRYRIHPNRNYHVFSELNENSLHLAKQIRANHHWQPIVFCQTKSASSTLLAQSKEIGAIHLYASCSAIPIPLIRNVFQFYLISTDEDRNLHDTEQLICRHRNKLRKQILINAFAESGTGIQVVESMKAEKIHVHFIDSTAMLCNNLLLKHPLYAGLGDRKLISAAIVGCDKTGIRMLKTIAWSGQIDGYSLKIRVYDKNASAVEQRFLVQCPELKENCDIDFITVNTDSVEFEQKILEHSPDATYIVTAMGDDEQNIAVAVRLYQIFRVYHNFKNWSPKILARTRSSVKSELYVSQDNNFLKQRNIHLFGRTEEVYSKSSLFYSDLERLAFAVHMCYSKSIPESTKDLPLLECLMSEAVRNSRKEFLQSEYNRRSSIATALHIPAKLFSWHLISENDDALSDAAADRFAHALNTDSDLVTQLAKNEHQRWNCFMRSEGYCSVSPDSIKNYWNSAKPSHQDKLSKRHPCITGWEELDPLFAQYNGLLEEHQKPILLADENFQQTDMDIIRKIPDIIRFANRLKQTNLDQIVFLRNSRLHLLLLTCKFKLAELMKSKESDT